MPRKNLICVIYIAVDANGDLNVLTISGIHLDKRTVSTVSTLQFGRMPILSINLENYCKYFIAQRHVSKWLTSLTICEEH